MSVRVGIGGYLRTVGGQRMILDVISALFEPRKKIVSGQLFKKFEDR
jgi:hypothetical protein